MTGVRGKNLHEFSYDGTLEGFLCVVYRCLELQVLPSRIVATALLPKYGYTPEIGSDVYSDICYVRTDYRAADRLYRYIGQRSSPEVQQMIYDTFLTAIPEREMDIFVMIYRALKHGSRILENYDDDCMSRIHNAVRDLYREAQWCISNMNYVNFDGAQIGIITPKNIVLPVMRIPVLKDSRSESTMVYDSRHRMILIKADDRAQVYDIEGLCTTDYKNTEELYRSLWPYFSSGEVTVIKNNLSHMADSLSSLWYIA